MKLISEAFADGTSIPDKYTKYGENRIPPLRFEDIPPNARSLALVVDDPDATKGIFNHWVIFNLDPHQPVIQENQVPENALQGKNDWGEEAYGGPRPPSGEHRYFFKGYALDRPLALSRGIKRDDLERAMGDHILDSAILIGKYAR